MPDLDICAQEAHDGGMITFTFLPTATPTPAYALAKGDYIIRDADFFIKVELVLNTATGPDSILIDTRSVTIYRDGTILTNRFTHDAHSHANFDACHLA